MLLPTTAESAEIAPPPIALYAAEERVVDAERVLCLPTLPSVTGRVCVPEVWRIVSKRNRLDMRWLERIRDTMLDELCGQLEALDNTQHTLIMSALKAQFCVSFDFIPIAQTLRIIAGGDRRAEGEASPLVAAASAAFFVVDVARQAHVAQCIFSAGAEPSGDRTRALSDLRTQFGPLRARRQLRCGRRDAACRERQKARRRDAFRAR